MKKTETIFKFSHYISWGLKYGKQGDWLKVIKKCERIHCNGGYIPFIKIEYFVQEGIYFCFPGEHKNKEFLEKEYCITENEFLCLKQIIRENQIFAGNLDLSPLYDVCDAVPDIYYFNCDDFYGYLKTFPLSLSTLDCDEPLFSLEYLKHKNISEPLIDCLIGASKDVEIGISKIVNFFESCNIEIPFGDFELSKHRKCKFYPLPTLDDKELVCY